MSTPSTLRQNFQAVTALAYRLRTLGSPAQSVISDHSPTPTAGVQYDDNIQIVLAPHTMHQAFRAYLSNEPDFIATPTHINYYSNQTDAQLDSLAHAVYREVLRRSAMTPVPQSPTPRACTTPSSASCQRDFSRYSEENLKAVVRHVDAELVRRHPQVTDINSSIFAPKPRHVTPAMSSDAASAQLPTIRQMQPPRRVLSPDGVRRLSVCTVPARVQSPLCRTSSRSPVSASSRYSSDFSWIPSEQSGDDVRDDLESGRESPIPIPCNKYKTRKNRDKDTENRRLKRQLAEANSKIQDAEVRSVAFRSLLCPWAAPPDPHVDAREEERDVQARLLLRDVLTTPSTEQSLTSRSELAVPLLRLMQKTLDYHRRDTNAVTFTHSNRLGRLIVKLSRKSRAVPDLVQITGIKEVSRDVYECGGFADIFKAKWNQENVALKRLRIFKTTDDTPTIREAFYREAIVWRQIEHKFILPFYGVDNETFPNAPCMVSPFIRGGNVHKAMLELSKANAKIPYNRWLLETAEGLEYLHSQEIVHGDVRGANMLIDQHGHVKMADFGLAFFSGASIVSFGTEPGGATRWLAPELLESVDKNRLPDTACDVFSFGRLCIELYTHRVPFPDLKLDAQVATHVLIRGGCPQRPTYENGKEIPEQLWQLIQSCWARDPMHRPTTKHIVRALSQQPA